MKIFVKNSPVRLDNEIAKGGEARIYQLDHNTLLRLYKRPDDPDYAHYPDQGRAAEKRLQEMQTKLLAFPKGLPDNVISPRDFAYDDKQLISGFTMDYLKGMEVLRVFSDPNFRRNGINNNMVVELYRRIYDTIHNGLHRNGVVIGDNNDLNILVDVSKLMPYFIDMDAAQYGGFYSKSYMTKYLDPMLSKPDVMELAKPHTEISEWYSFMIMLFESLLFTSPYGGIFKKKVNGSRVKHNDRPLHRITVFNPDVKYPKPAVHYSVLPDELIDYYQKVFENDHREVFPRRFLETLKFVKCVDCGTEHARHVCPTCKKGVATPVSTVTGRVVAKYLFQTTGIIVYGTVQNNQLKYIYHENGEYKREDGRVILKRHLDPQMKFRISGNDTLIGSRNTLISIDRDGEITKYMVDSYNGLVPLFDGNLKGTYLVSDGTLKSSVGRSFGYGYIGGVLRDRTLMWVGDTFGVGFYTIGKSSAVGFVFDVGSKGLNDSLILKMDGKLTGANAVFTTKLCWLFMTFDRFGKSYVQIYVISKEGNILSHLEVEPHEYEWLQNIYGKFATGNALYSSTDNGLVKIEYNNGIINKVNEFPDTEPYLSSASQLVPFEGISVIEKQKLISLKLT